MSTYASELLLTVGIGYVDALLWSRGKGLGVTVLRRGVATQWCGYGPVCVSHVGTASEPVVDHQLFCLERARSHSHFVCARVLMCTCDSLPQLMRACFVPWRNPPTLGATIETAKSKV